MGSRREGRRRPVKRALLSDRDLGDAMNQAGVWVVVLGDQLAAAIEGES